MFKIIKQQLQDNFAQMLSLSDHLFYVTIDRDGVWEEYLAGFEEEEKQEHNCNSCKSFLRQYAGIVSIIDGKRVSIWDGIEAPDEYRKSIENLQKYIHSLPITDVFLNEFAKCGVDKNRDSVREVTWEHFFLVLPSRFVNKNTIDSVKGSKRTNYQTLKRALTELSVDSIETVLDLIAQNSLYRGKESEDMLSKFLTIKKQFLLLPDDESKDNFCWIKSVELPPSLSGIRSSSIGTLLVNLTEGMELDLAVTKFETMVAPSNYKRPTALVTPKMIESAKVAELKSLIAEKSVEELRGKSTQELLAELSAIESEE